MTVRFNRISQCDGKMPFSRKADVKRAIRNCERRLGSRMMAYRCPHCDYWHMGHKPPVAILRKDEPS